MTPFCYLLKILICFFIMKLPVPAASSVWNIDNSLEKETGSRKNRHFKDCVCIQKLRTTYITSSVCGQAALCYWEIWNYKYLKFKAKGENYTDEDCDKYMVQKFACLIGYPKPQHPNEQCYKARDQCNRFLARILYKDCEPIRKERGLPKPEDVDWRINAEGLNYGLKQDDSRIFKPRPSVEKPTDNAYYKLSCPIIYRFPYFTIDLLLRTVDPKVHYDETLALGGVGEMLPKHVREGVNNERILNFDALSLDDSMINWCRIPRNYICIHKELDPNWDICSEKYMKPKRKKCEGPNAMPPRVSADEATNSLSEEEIIALPIIHSSTIKSS